MAFKRKILSDSIKQFYLYILQIKAKLFFYVYIKLLKSRNSCILTMTHLPANPLLYFHGQVLDKDTCMYAVSQGAMAVECRNSDPFTLSLLSQIHHPETVIQCVAERAFLKKLVCTALLL